MQTLSLNLQGVTEDFLKIYDHCILQLDDPLRIHEVKTLAQRIQKGSSLNIGICGAAKAGKSTFLNHLLSPSEDPIRIFLSGNDVETCIPWLLTEDKAQDPDSIAVSHIFEQDNRPVESKKEIFTNLGELHKYLDKNYSRKVIEEIARKNQTYLPPYQQINLSCGVSSNQPSKIFYNPLFEDGIKLLDLQGMNEIGAGVSLSLLERPFVLLCCFDCTTSFFQTNQLAQLKEIINAGNPDHVIFIGTHVTKHLRNMRNENEDEKLDDELLADEKESIRKELNQLKEEFIDLEFDLFLFDPDFESDGNIEEIKRGFEFVRQRLISVKKGLGFEKKFQKEMCIELSSEVYKLRNELVVYALTKTDTSFLENYKLTKEETDKLSKELNEELIDVLRKLSPEELEGKIQELAKKKEKYFMDNKPGYLKINERLNQWLVRNGLHEVVSEIFKEKIIKFQSLKKNEVKRILEGAFGSISEIEYKALSFPELRLQRSFFLTFFTSLLKKISHFLWFKWQGLKSVFNQPVFDTVLSEWMENIKPFITSEDFLKSYSEKVAELSTKRFVDEMYRQLTHLYVQTQNQDFDKHHQYLMKEKNIDLDRILKLLDQIDGAIDEC